MDNLNKSTAIVVTFSHLMVNFMALCFQVQLEYV
jgi:hypothetical protein